VDEVFELGRLDVVCLVAEVAVQQAVLLCQNNLSNIILLVALVWIDSAVTSIVLLGCPAQWPMSSCLSKGVPAKVL